MSKINLEPDLNPEDEFGHPKKVEDVQREEKKPPPEVFPEPTPLPEETPVEEIPSVQPPNFEDEPTPEQNRVFEEAFRNIEPSYAEQGQVISNDFGDFNPVPFIGSGADSAVPVGGETTPYKNPYVPPEKIDAETILEELLARPFRVTKVSDTEVTVNQGYCHWKGAWVSPTWTGGGAFDTPQTASGTLRIRLTVQVDGAEAADACEIGWDLSGSTSLPSRAYEITEDEYGTLSVTETLTEGTILIDVAVVAGSLVTTQYIDYNPVLPWNRDIDTTVAGGGTSIPGP